MDEYWNELLTEAYRLYQEEIESRHPDDYEVYLPNMSKLMCTYGFLSQYAAEHGGSIENLKFDRRETSGGITAYFTVLDLKGEELTEFCRFTKEAHALSIDALIDGTVCLSMTFTDVFKKIR